MSYLKIKPQGVLSVVHEHEIAEDLTRMNGINLIVCNSYSEASKLANKLALKLDICKLDYNLTLKSSTSTYIFSGQNSYHNFAGLQFTAAYVQRGHSLNLAVQLMARVKEYPN